MPLTRIHEMMEMRFLFNYLFKRFWGQLILPPFPQYLPLFLILFYFQFVFPQINSK